MLKNEYMSLPLCKCQHTITVTHVSTSVEHYVLLGHSKACMHTTIYALSSTVAISARILKAGSLAAASTVVSDADMHCMHKCRDLLEKHMA